MTVPRFRSTAARDFAAEDATRTVGLVGLRLTTDEQGALDRAKEALAAPTKSQATVAALAALEALLSGKTADEALAAAKAVASRPPPKPGWRKGKPRS